MRTNWKQRLEDWAPQPPDGVWEKLAQTLPTPQYPFAGKLHQWEAAPPPRMWTMLEAQLEDTPGTTPVMQMYPRSKWLRVASVAASVLFAFFFLRPFFTNPKKGTSVPTPGAIQQSIFPLPITAGQNRPPLPDTTKALGGVSRRRLPAAVVARLPLPPKTNGPLPTAAARSASAETSIQPTKALLHALNNSMAERYIVLANSENEAVRLARHLYAAYHCDEQPDPAGCLELLSALRSEMAQPSLLAPADFSGVLEVVRRVKTAQ